MDTDGHRSRRRILLGALLAIAGCTAAAEPRPAAVELVRKEIREGMSQADVSAALGAPSRVTTDTVGREAWVYDQLAAEAAAAHTNAHGTILVLGIGEAAASPAPRALTVVIRFDRERKVESFTYHAGRS